MRVFSREKENLSKTTRETLKRDSQKFGSLLNTRIFRKRKEEERREVKAAWKSKHTSESISHRGIEKKPQERKTVGETE